MSLDIPPDAGRAAAGIGGALFAAAVFVMRRQWAMAVVVTVGGSVMGYFFGPELSKAWGNRISDIAGTALMASAGCVLTFKVIEGIHSFDAKRAGRELWLGFLRKIGFRK